jgi:tRNA-splicing ligase RtcB
MEWVKNEDTYRVPIKSWCSEIDDGALKQASDLARHPVVFKHVALMPDCHLGYGMGITCSPVRLELKISQKSDLIKDGF